MPAWVEVLIILGGIALVIGAFLLPDGNSSSFQSDLWRIEGQVRRARCQVERLEREATKALQDATARHRLGR